MADPKSILVVRPASLDDAMRAAMADAGVLIVEAANPEDVRLLTAEPMPLSGSDMLYAAIWTLASYGHTQPAFDFVVKMANMMAEARAPKPPPLPGRDRRGRFAKNPQA